MLKRAFEKVPVAIIFLSLGILLGMGIFFAVVYFTVHPIDVSPIQNTIYTLKNA